MSEKGLVFDIKRFAVHDGKGIRTTVFLKGCPLRCAWCHNPEGMVNKRKVWWVQKNCIGCGNCIRSCSREALRAEPEGIHRVEERCIGCGACVDVCPAGAMRWDSSWMTVEEVMEILRRDRIAYEKSGGGITVSGGEPTGEQAGFALALLAECKKEGFRTSIESSLYTNPEVLEQFEEVVDDFIVDIKIFDSVRHKKAAGVDNQLILDNIWALASRHALLIRTPMIPGYTSDLDNIQAIGEFVKKLPNARMELLNFNPLYSQKYHYQGREPVCPQAEKLSNEEMEQRRQILERMGISVVR